MPVTFWLEAVVVLTPWWMWAAGAAAFAASAVAIWRL